MSPLLAQQEAYLDTPAAIGTDAALGMHVRNSHLRRRAYAEAVSILRFVERARDTSPETFAGLVKAISKGDRAIEDQIFRLWGIRR